MSGHPAAFQAVFSDWRLIKGRKVVQVVLEIPIEAADAAYHVLGGMPDPSKSVWCGVARLNLNAGERHGPPATGGEVATPAGDGLPARPKLRNRLSQQAAMCCNDPVFQSFLRHNNIAATTVLSTTDYVRNVCGVHSRSEIIPDTPAGIKWEQLYSRFRLWRDVPELAAS